MKRTYQNTRKISLYVSLIGGFLTVFFGIFSLLHPEKHAFSIISCLCLLIVALDLLISARLLLFDQKKFSLVHAWVVSLFCVFVFSSLALILNAQQGQGVFQIIADSVLILNAFIALLLLVNAKASLFNAFYSFIPIAAMIVIRSLLGQWFLFAIVTVGVGLLVVSLLKIYTNKYLKALLFFEGVVLIIGALVSFFFDMYDLAFPVVRMLSGTYVYLFAAFVLETPKDELPVMVPKSPEDLWAEKYLHMITRSYKSFSESEMLNQPLSALKTITEDEAKLLEEIFGIVTVRDLATNPYFNMSKEILDQSKLNKN